jgi:DNA-binding Lrp family transcriptional regulator
MEKYAVQRVYILIRAHAGKMWHVRSMIDKIEGINEVHVITGPYDLVADAELQSPAYLKELLDKIHKMDGVISTETWVAI